MPQKCSQCQRLRYSRCWRNRRISMDGMAAQHWPSPDLRCQLWWRLQRCSFPPSLDSEITVHINEEETHYEANRLIKQRLSSLRLMSLALT